MFHVSVKIKAKMNNEKKGSGCRDTGVEEMKNSGCD